MRKTILITIIVSLTLLLTSCSALLDYRPDDALDSFMRENMGEEYEQALNEYEKETENLKENKDEILGELESSADEIIDSEIGSDEEKSTAAKGAVDVVIDLLDKLVFGGFDPVWPVESSYEVSAVYYYKDGSRHSCHNSYLTGMDLVGGGNILATEKGKVIVSEYSKTSGLGNWIKIEHENGMTSVYAHLKSRAVEKGDEVKKGEVIGVMGNTSAKYKLSEHLHFELADENKEGDAWQTYFKDKYKEELIYQPNVVSNNEKFNKNHIISDWITENYELKGGKYHYAND